MTLDVSGFVGFSLKCVLRSRRSFRYCGHTEFTACLRCPPSAPVLRLGLRLTALKRLSRLFY